jgi:hypothetical protein
MSCQLLCFHHQLQSFGSCCQAHHFPILITMVCTVVSPAWTYNSHLTNSIPLTDCSPFNYPMSCQLPFIYPSGKQFNCYIPLCSGWVSLSFSLNTKIFHISLDVYLIYEAVNVNTSQAFEYYYWNLKYCNCNISHEGRVF